jgi:hypothetical protein
MGEQKVLEQPKLVVVYFANGTKQWVKTGSANQWAREGGYVHKFYEGKVYSTLDGRKVKVKQHFKLLNTVLMDVDTGEFLETDRTSLLNLQAEDSSSDHIYRWSEVDWSCEIVFEKKEEKRPFKPAVKLANASSDSSVAVE